MITVLQVIPSLVAGGAEQACVDVAAALKAAGHRPIVVSSGGPRVAEILQSGGEHLVRPVHSKNPLIIIQNAFWMARFIRERKVDIVHARSRAPAWSAFIACSMTGKPYVATNHAAYPFSNIFKKFYNSVMVRADRIIAISDFVAGHIRQHYSVMADKIRTIPRGIDLDKFALEKISEGRKQNLRQSWGITPDQPLLLAPSRLSPLKGQAVLIEAMALLPFGLKNITAVILGHDQGRTGYRQKLHDLIIERKLQGRVKLVEHCNDMPAAYSLAQLVVAPSLVPEGFGRVPVEAMIMGVPVIATELGGFVETIRPGATGWLVPANDAKALADAIIKAFNQTPEERTVLVQTAMQHARALYDKNKMVADTLTVYEELAL